MGKTVSIRERMLGVGTRVVGVALVLGLVAVAATFARSITWEVAGGASGRLSQQELQRHIGRAQLARISAALDVYRLERGDLPRELTHLVETGLLLPDDLRYPWREGYYYRRVDAREFVLLPPLR